jgi:hypothetical protein
MKQLVCRPYAGLVLTGLVSSLALLIESRLDVSESLHFLLQFVWIGVVSSALLACALIRAAGAVQPQAHSENRDTIPELLDADRSWLQSHPGRPMSE